MSPQARNTSCAWPAAEAKPPGPWGSSPPDQEGFLAHICVFPKQRDTKISLKGSKPAVCLPVARLRQVAVGGEQGHWGDGVPGLQASLGRAGRNQAGEHCALGTGQSHPESTQRARVLKMSSRGERGPLTLLSRGGLQNSGPLCFLEIYFFSLGQNDSPRNKVIMA